VSGPEIDAATLEGWIERLGLVDAWEKVRDED
jgi:hypothetical protein